MDEILQLNEFFVEGGNQELSHVLLHITEPSTPEEMQKGYFFALCEMNHADPAYIAKLQAIIDTAENEYYETPDDGDKTSLEVILEKINQQAYNLTHEHVELHCVVGAIRQPDIVFAYSGKPHMFLFYKNKHGLYQRLDLITADAATATEPSKQLFSDIIQGKISPRDFLFVATPKLVEYFSPDRLQKIITTRAARQSAEHIERVLSDLREGYSFGGLILHIHQPSAQEVPVKKQRPVLRTPAGGAFTSLFTTERQTAHTLSPSIIPKMSDAVKSIFKEKPPQPTPTTPRPAPIMAEINATHKSAHRPRSTSPANTPTSEKITVVLQALWKALFFVGKVIVWIAVALYSICYNALRNLVLLGVVAINYQNRRRNILEQWDRQWRSYRDNLRQLPLITKILFLASIALVIIFAISIMYVRHRQQNIARQEAFEKTLQEFKKHKDSMESLLIYHDEAGALRELEAARTLLTNLNCDEKDNKDACTTMNGQLTEIATRIRKVTNVAPALLAEWSSLSTEPQSLVRVGSLMVAYSETTSTLFAYNVSTTENTTYTTLPEVTGFSEATAPKENDYAAFVYDKNKLLSFNPADFTSKGVDISYPNNNVVLTGLAVYNRRLYVLDATNSTVYRHDTIRSGFEQGTVWNENGKESLIGGDSLTIDGDIFTLTDKGQVSKFSKGALQPFAITGLDPALTNGGTIWTYTDSKNVYILDSIGKRLIILDKDGKLKQQLTSSLFVNPSGVVIDEPSNIAYVLDSGKLLPIQHMIDNANRTISESERAFNIDGFHFSDLQWQLESTENKEKGEIKNAVTKLVINGEPYTLTSKMETYSDGHRKKNWHIGFVSFKFNLSKDVGQKIVLPAQLYLSIDNGKLKAGSLIGPRTSDKELLPSGFGIAFFKKILEHIQHLATELEKPITHELIASDNYGLTEEKWRRVFEPVLNEYGYAPLTKKIQSFPAWEKVYRPQTA